METVGGVASAIGDDWSLPDGEGRALPGEGGVPGPCLDRLASILCTRGVVSHLVGW